MGNGTQNETHCYNRNRIRFWFIIVFILFAKKIFSCLNPFTRPAGLEEIRGFIARMKNYPITKVSVFIIIKPTRQTGHLCIAIRYITESSVSP
jgi:hypothetical protein